MYFDAMVVFVITLIQIGSVHTVAISYTFGIFMDCFFLSRIYWSSLDYDLIARIWETVISFLAGILNSGPSYLTIAVALGKYCQSFITSSLNYDVWYVVAKGASIYLWKIMDYKHAYFFFVIPFLFPFLLFLLWITNWKLVSRLNS